MALGPVSHGGIAQFSRRPEPCPKGAGVQEAGPLKGGAHQEEPVENQGERTTTTTHLPREEGLLPSMPPGGCSPTTPTPGPRGKEVSFFKKWQK